MTIAATWSDEAEKSCGSVPEGISTVTVPPAQVRIWPTTSPSMVVVATTLTSLAVGDSAGVSAGVAAAEAAALIGAGGCGALESAEPQAEITRVAAAITTRGAFRMP